MSGDRFELPTRRLKGVHFSSFSTAETKQLSVKELTNPVSFDSLQHPTIGGLYDPAMGPVELQDFCTTCHQKAMHCPGHMAHISLPLPVFNPLYFPLACQLLKVTCLCCDHLLLTKPRIHLIKCQLRLLFKGLLVEALELEDIFYRGITNGNEDSSNTVESLGDVSLLDEFVDAAMGDSDAQSSAGRAQSKNLNEARRAIVDQFFKSFNQFKECGNCSAPARKLKKEGMKKVLLKPLSAREAKQWALAKQQHWSKQPTDIKEGKEAPSYDNELKVSQEIQYLSPLDIRSHLMQLFQLEGQLLSMLISLSKGAVGADMFFLEVIPVPPPKFRPSNFASGLRYDNPQTTNLNLVLKSSQELHQLLKEESQEKEEPVDRKTHIQQVHSAWQTLQFSVSSFIDSDIFKFSTNRPSGVRQILEKKDGLFRKHLMGKRVNYAARSVISPDPYINVDEVGIPMVFAQKLTFPQPVTSLNVQEMREAVTNGPLGYPGATKVEHEDGTITRLNPENLSQRKSLAKQLLTPPVRWNPLNTCKKVHRYLKDGDMLLLNRQPTLHRPSIMGHKARVLKGQKTLRLHYSNCKSYNADFDGDEMNVHFPQNELGRAEVLTVASANFQYLVPKDGKPLGGLIQDHLVSAVLMTARGCLFNRQDYMQLVFCALPECESRIAFLPPCICKPSHLWSGKQIISTILLTLIPSTSEKLNMTGQSKVPHKEWKNTNSRALFSQLRDEEMSESEIVVRGGELLCGVLDKSQIGPSQFGLAHCCYELYGGEMVGKLLSALAKLLTSYLQYHGFTLGVEDILVKPKGDHKRTKLLKKAGECGPFAAAKAFELADHSDTDLLKKTYQAAHRSTDDSTMKLLDYTIKGKLDLFTEDINKAVIPGLLKKFPLNSLQLMTHSGAKGSMVNCMQISCLLGQIELEGRRPPLMASGRSLPSFLPYDMSPRAGGFVGGRFLTGIKPQEYFFHCMAGREGLVDTAVKTSRSGYLQRCLIKHMEALKVGYDQTVRDGDASVIQFLYGEDGLDVTKTRFMSKKQFPFIAQNYSAFLPQCNPEGVLSTMNTRKAPNHQAKVDRWKERNGGRPKGKSYSSGFHLFSAMHLPELRDRIQSADMVTTKAGNVMPRTRAELKLIESWYSLGPPGRQSYKRRARQCPDPTLSRYQPGRYFGSVSEKLEDLLDDYVGNNPDGLLCDEESTTHAMVHKGKFSTMVELKFMRSLIEPGESVGLLASQSIGEPSTQMTLNTFHFAGRGEMNVTLGIPRLREILMVASVHIKTPTMEVPVLDLPEAHEKCVELQRQLTKVSLSQLLQKIEVWESLSRLGDKATSRRRIYCIRLHFQEHSSYENQLCITPDDVIEYMEQSFFKSLIKAVRKQMKVEEKRRVNAIYEAKATERQSKRVQNEAQEEDNQDDELSDADLGDDADASEAKSRQKKQQHATYDDPDEDDEEIIQTLDKETLNDSDEASEGTGPDDSSSVVSELISDTINNGGNNSGEEEHEEKEDEEEDAGGLKLDNETNQLTPDKGRIMAVLEKSPHIIAYKFDTVQHLWCEVTLQFPVQDSKVIMKSLVERMAEHTVIHEIPGIKRSFVQQKDSGMRLTTEGVNIQELWKYPTILNLSQLYCNSIHDMANAYGIEAARSILIKEIQSVFKAYGIEVDPRHLSLIADYMCFSGTYRPLNRLGIDSNTSPFQKMSYETTVQFLKKATLSGETDRLESPSSCLVCGRIVGVGTGCCELLHALSV